MCVYTGINVDVARWYSSRRGLRLVPWASIAERAPTRAFAGSSKFFREILLWNLFKELRLTIANIDLADGDLVEPWLNEPPDGAKPPWGIYDVEFAHAFGIVFLAYLGGLVDIILDCHKVGESDVVEIEDGA